MKYKISNDHFRFMCPGCDHMHVVPVDGTHGWVFEESTVSLLPSILIRSGHYAEGHKGKECWCTYEKRLGEPAPFKCSVCHLFVRNGKIEYCADSTHALAGQTIPMIELEH